MSTSRTMPGGWADRSSLEKGPNGRPLCRWCNLEIPLRRFTFCSDFCVHQWKLRTDPGYLRDQVLARDRGVCAMCDVDTVAAFADLKRARGVHKLKLLERWGLKKFARRSLWDADHILPVVEGGGECDLDNLRTLCLVCHKDVTQKLRQKMLTDRYKSSVLI